jgi:hypothetical protein
MNRNHSWCAFSLAFLEEYLDERKELNPDGRCRSASVEVIEFEWVWLAALDDFRNWLIREAA